MTKESDSSIFTGREVTQKVRVLSKPQPSYTEEARQAQITGTVVLRSVFSDTGEIIKIRAVSELPHGLTGIGGIVGLSIGWLLTLLLSLLLPSYVPLWAPIGGLVASVGIGLIFGLWPAWKAARLDPIESLRYE